MTFLTKLLVSTGVVSAAGALSVGAYYVSLPKTVGDKLIGSGLTPLNFKLDSGEDQDAWKAKIQKHKNTSENNPAKISGLKLDDSKEEENIKAFKKKCKELLDVSLSENGYEAKEKDAKNWCFKG